ncbi:hypothetical protein V7O67_13110 [Methanolobus sp. ZRKC4]|uniref:hypothetical protein n=1 Tax=Methanolobus sp. ZRKC4 TaxID=3125787 RepID=UPI003247DC8E
MDKVISELNKLPFGEKHFFGSYLVERVSEDKFLVNGSDMDLIGAATWILSED